MANIMLITDYYPPRKSIASNRMEAFAKYLTEFGHKVYVITLGDKDEYMPGCIDVFWCQDKDAFRLADTNVAENKYVHYAKCAYNIVLKSCKTYSDKWADAVVDCARSIFNNTTIDVMITSYPTIGTMVAGNKIKKQFPQLKWIADMRDAVWTTENNAIVKYNLCSISQKCFINVDAVLAVSEPQREYYALLSNKPCYVLRNGYDFDLCDSNELCNNDSFVLAYTGNFYGDISPYNFLKACKNLLIKGAIPAFRLEIIGNHSVVEVDDVLADRVFFKGRMEYFDLIKYCRENVELLLLVIPKSREKGVYTGKLFDYIGIGKPILGLVPADDVAANLINEAGNGYLAENEDIPSIESAILRAYKDWEDNTLRFPNKDIMCSCHRREGVRLLNRIIEGLLKDNYE